MRYHPAAQYRHHNEPMHHTHERCTTLAAFKHICRPVPSCDTESSKGLIQIKSSPSRCAIQIVNLRKACMHPQRKPEHTTTIPSYYHPSILPSRHTTIPSYYHPSILPSLFTTISSYYHPSILPSLHTTISS